MTVIDLIIKLQQLPPNHKVFIDATRDGADGFCFRNAVDADTAIIDPLTNKEVVIIAPYFIDGEEEQE